jgi:hypothetical protein
VAGGCVYSRSRQAVVLRRVLPEELLTKVVPAGG